jgi:hypothetical protein
MKSSVCKVKHIIQREMYVYFMLQFELKLNLCGVD